MGKTTQGLFIENVKQEGAKGIYDVVCLNQLIKVHGVANKADKVDKNKEIYGKLRRRNFMIKMG